MEIRFFRRSSEYMHKEAIALSDGVNNQGVEVITLPDDVLGMLAEASASILATEAEKGPIAAKAADVYKSLMSDLGYA